MGITVSSPENDGPITTLVGSLRDQAKLLGVLNNLYELHLPILSVEILKSTSYDDEEVVEKFDLQDKEGGK
jgi:hypothetical protein